MIKIGGTNILLLEAVNRISSLEQLSKQIQAKVNKRNNR